MEPDLEPDRLLGRLRRPVLLTLAGLWAERLVRAFWPLWSIVISALAALAFGAQDHLPIEVFWFGVLSVLLGAAWAAIRGARQFHRPTGAEALARVDAALPGQPLAALLDEPALGRDDPLARALWQAHRLRMARRAADARPAAPDLRLADRDPFALRYVALLALTMALAFGSLWQAASVTGLMPGAGAQAAGPAWEAWAEPPAYTGKPVLYLPQVQGDSLALPVGSRIRLRFYGEPGQLILAETVSARTEVPPASAAAQDFAVTRSGQLTVQGPGGRSFAVEAIPDAPPTIAAEGEVTREADGRFGLRFRAADDYGIRSGEVAIALDLSALDRRHGLAIAPEPEALSPVVLDLPLPMRRDRTAIAQKLTDSLSESLLSNLPVTLTLSVTDASGQTGVAPEIHTLLPGRRFFDPLAQAVIEMRRDLMWNRANAPRVAEILKAVTWQPEGFVTNNRAYLRLRVLIRQLDAQGAALSAADRDAMVAELWRIAVLFEDGDLASALDRLHRAQDRLSQAIRNGASPEEIDRLMQEMRQAMADYLRQQGEQAGQDQAQTQASPEMTLSQDQLQGMLNQLEQLLKDGRMTEAQDLMDQLNRLMENLRVTRAAPGPGSPGQQAMRDLGQMLKDQQGLADDSFRGLQSQNEGGAAQDGQGLADRQQELRDRLDGLRKPGTLPGQGPGQDDPAGAEGQRQLDRADRAMKGAEQALREGELGSALDRQAEALDALREGMKSLDQALAQNDKPGNPDGMAQTDRQDPTQGRDPLGRAMGAEGRMSSDSGMLQGPDVYRRAQDLLDEIRKRAGEQGRPEDERSYLRRLLDLF